MATYDHYASRGKTRLGVAFVRMQNQKIYREIAGLIPLEGRILEIGPGEGDFARLLLSQGHIYEAREANKILAEKLTQNNIQVKIGKCPPIDAADSTFDLVYASHLLEHQENSQQALDFVSECRRVLRPGGHLVLVVPDYLRMGKEFFNVDYTHSFVTTERRLLQLTQDAGLTYCRTRFFTGPVFGPLRLLLNLLNKGYNYNIARVLLSGLAHPDFFYKIRITLAESILLVAKKVN